MNTKRFWVVLLGGLVGAAWGSATAVRGGTDAIWALDDSRSNSSTTKRSPFKLETTIHEMSWQPRTDPDLAGGGNVVFTPLPVNRAGRVPAGDGVMDQPVTNSVAATVPSAPPVRANPGAALSPADGILAGGGGNLDDDLDADGDGLRNKWELDHELDPLSSAGDHGADGDPDGDGLTNLQEQTAGTHPRHKPSWLQVAP